MPLSTEFQIFLNNARVPTAKHRFTKCFKAYDTQIANEKID